MSRLTGPELLSLKGELDKLIQEKFKAELGNRTSRRAKVKLRATCVIEREKEFFAKEHSAAIKEMSVNGLYFETEALVYKNDLLRIAFRSPADGTMKMLDCVAVRIDESSGKKDAFQIAAVAVDQTKVKEYKEMLKTRASQLAGAVDKPAPKGK